MMKTSTRTVVLTGLLLVVFLSGGIQATSAAPSVFSCTSVSQIPQTECQALVALYNSTNGSGWRHNDDWLTTNTPCSWFGVTCTGGHVTSLELSENKLKGSIPAQLGNLAQLTYLNLSDNQLSGIIPTQLGNLINAYSIYLSGNRLSGNIPSQMGSLTNLVSLYLDGNLLTGSIPSQFGSLTSLRTLTLSNNRLSGSVPAQLGNLSALLLWLLIDHNQLSGPLPMSLTNLPLAGFLYHSTDLCAPAAASFQNWQESIWELETTGLICGQQTPQMFLPLAVH